MSLPRPFVIKLHKTDFLCDPSSSLLHVLHLLTSHSVWWSICYGILLLFVSETWSTEVRGQYSICCIFLGCHLHLPHEHRSKRFVSAGGIFKLTLKVLVTIDALGHFLTGLSTVGGDGGCRVGEVRAGTTCTSPMPDHKGFKLQYTSNCQRSAHSISKWIFRNLAL